MNGRTACLVVVSLVATVVSLVVGLAGCRAAESRRDAVWLDEAALLDGADDPDADAIVLLREHRIVIQLRAKTTEMRVHEATKILSEAAFERAMVQMAWPASAELLHLDGRTIARDGTITPVDGAELLASEFQVDTGDEQEKVSARFFQFPRVEIGSVLELSYTIRVQGAYTTWAEQMTDTVPVREYRVEIVVDEDVVPQMLVLHHPARPTKGVQRDGFKGVRLVAKDLPAHVHEPLSPSWQSSQPWWMYRMLPFELPQDAYFTSLDWSVAMSFMKDVVVDGKGFEALPALDVDGCRGKTSCVVNVALDKTRELTTFTGLSDGIEHRKLDEILQDGTARSAEKAVLLYALLKRAGLDASLVAAARTSTLKIKKEFASRRWFNHALVLVRDHNAETWIDPSCELCAPGMLPSWDPIGGEVLVLSSDRGELWASWKKLNGNPAPHENLDARLVTIVLDRTGDATVDIEGRQTGEIALFRHASTRNDNADEQRRAALAGAREVSPAAELLSFVPLKCDRRRGVCTQSLKARVPHMAHAAKDGLRVQLDALRDLYDLDPGERRSDVVVTRPVVSVDEVRLVPPAGMRIANVPEPVSLDTSLMQIHSSAEVDGGALVVKRAMRLRPGRLTREQIWPLQSALDVGAAPSWFVVHVANDRVADR